MTTSDNYLTRRRFIRGIGTAGVTGLAGCSTLESSQQNKPTDETAASLSPLTRNEHRGYWFGRYNMNAMLLMTGLGERLTPSNQQRERLATLADFELSEMPANPYLLKAVYASGDPHFQQEADFNDFSTLNWDRSAMDETLTPEAQAFTIKKIVGRNLRTRYHQYGKDRFIALVQLQEAMALAKTLRTRLTTTNGLVATRTPDGELAEPTPEQQAAALMAYSGLALSLTDPDRPLFQTLPNAEQFAKRVSRWAEELFTAAQQVEPTTVRELALTLEAYGWFAAATDDDERQSRALSGIRPLAERLRSRHEGAEASLTTTAWAVYGLGEASQVTGSDAFAGRARRLFFEELERYWQADAGVYVEDPDDDRHVYTPRKATAVVAAINTMRFVAPPGVGAVGPPDLAAGRYAAFVRNVLVRSGMQQAHAIPLAVNQAYLDADPRDYFTAESIPLSANGDGEFGLCPVYAAEIVFEGGDWAVTDRRFVTADAMHLADVSPSLGPGTPDGTIPIDRL
jgi:hypothetical protein